MKRKTIKNRVKITRHGRKASSLSGGQLRRQSDKPRAANLTLSKQARRVRIVFLGILLFGGATLISLRLHELQRADQKRWLELASEQHFGSLNIQGARGDIVDRNGVALASSVAAVSVGAHPKVIKSDAAVVERISSATGLSSEFIKDKIAADKNFVWIERGLPLSADRVLKGTPGVSVFREFRRYYPQGRLAGPILGRVSRSGSGQSGIERQYDNVLEADSYKISMYRDAKGQFLGLAKKPGSTASPFALVSEAHAAEVDAVTSPSLRDEGLGVQLSIDSMIQSILEEELWKGLENAKAKRTFAVMMDADTGELLAMGQTSKFNPNHYDNISPEDLRNSVIQDNFEPGSTFKPIVAALAMDAGVVTQSEVLDCTENGRFRHSRHTIKDVHPVGKGTLRDVLVESSNICMAKLGIRMGQERLYQGLKDFDFGRRSGIELPGEAKGILRNVKGWRKIDVATHSFGQGIAVTSLQLVRAYAALANGGILLPPTLLKRESGEEIPGAIRVLTPTTAETVMEMLSGVTEDERGTGRRARIPGLTVYGKTGTAQKSKINGRGYDPDKVLSSFIGIVDGSKIGVDRRFAFLVVVDEPTVSPRWGGTVAGPIFKRSMERTLSYLMAKSDAA